MAIGDPCERCGTYPETIKSGPFAGSRNTHDFCVYCSRDLCDDCIESGTCKDSPDGHHHKEDEN